MALTSATFNQIKNILWYELRKIYNNASVKPLGGILSVDPQSGLNFSDGRQIFGFSTKEPERAAGVSSPNLLYIVDEASGVPEDIFEAIEGNRAGGAKLAMFSNPTRTTGTFYQAFHGKSNFWHRLHISASESPNVAAGRKIIPGLATTEWIEEKRAEWGASSPLFQVRVEGNFPAQAENAVIGLHMVEEARNRYEETEAIGPMRIGVDVARYGDDESVVSVIRGNKAYPLYPFRNKDGIQLAGEVIGIATRLRRGGEERATVNVDVIGVGASAFDQLRATAPAWIDINAVNVASSPTNDLYSNLRAQIVFSLRDWLQEGGAIPNDPVLEAELVSPVYEFDSRGRYKLLPKEKEKDILGHSPDRRNALELAVYQANNWVMT